MQRPFEMRKIGLDRYEYQLIGQIAVLSGILEQEMKELIVRLVKAPWPDGMALTAHLNFGSMCDMALSLLPSCADYIDYGNSVSLLKAFDGSIRKARTAYDDRSRIIHGPFSPWTAHVGAKKSTLKMTARGKIKIDGATYDREVLADVFKALVDAHDSLLGCQVMLDQARGISVPEIERPQDRKANWRANPQKRQHQIPPTQA